MATTSEPSSLVSTIAVHCSGTVKPDTAERAWSDYEGTTTVPPDLQEPNVVQRAALSILQDDNKSLLCITASKTGKTTAVVLNCTNKAKQWNHTGAASSRPNSPLILYVVPSDTRRRSQLKVVALRGAPADYYPALHDAVDVLLCTLEKTTHLLNAKQIQPSNIRRLVFDRAGDISAVSTTGQMTYISSMLRRYNANLSTVILLRTLPSSAASSLTKLMSAEHGIITEPQIGQLQLATSRTRTTMTLPPNVAGCIIGPGGKLLAKLQQETQCTINIAPPARDGSQMLTLEGTTDGISFAISRCDRVFLQKGAKLRRKFAFPPTLTATIRGTNNCRLKHLQKQFYVYADLKEEDHSEYKSLCTLELTGFPEALDAATAYLDMLTKDNRGSVYEERVVLMHVPIAAKYHILGTQGLTLKGLQANFGVFLTFQHSQKTPTEIPLSIRGLPANIDNVKAAIGYIIQHPAEASKYALEKPACLSSWPVTRTRVAAIDSNSFDSSAYAPPRKYYVVTHRIRNAKFGRCNQEYQPVATGLRLYEQLFDKISTSEGLVDVQTRIDIAESYSAKATNAGNSDDLLTHHIALLEYCACLMTYLTEEAEAREMPSDDEVRWLRDLPPNFGHAEVQELFPFPLYDIVLHRKNAGDLAAAPSCLVVFRKAEHARAPNKCAERGLRVEKAPTFEFFYRAYARRVLTLRAILDGATIASQSLRHALMTSRRRQLTVDNNDQLQANQALELPVFEYTENVAADADTLQEDSGPSTSNWMPTPSHAATVDSNRPNAFAPQNQSERKQRVVHAFTGFKHVIRTLVRQLIAPASIPGKSKVESRQIQTNDFLVIIERMHRRFGKKKSIKNAIREAETQVAEECRKNNEPRPDINHCPGLLAVTADNTKDLQFWATAENPKQPAPRIWAIPKDDQLLLVDAPDALNRAIAIAQSFTANDIISLDCEWDCITHSFELFQCSGRNTTMVVDVQKLGHNPRFWRLVETIFSGEAMIFVLGVEDRKSSTGRFVSTGDRTVLTDLLAVAKERNNIPSDDTDRISAVITTRALMDIRHLVHNVFKDQYENDPGCKYLRQNPRPLLQAQINYAWSDAISLVKIAKYVRTRKREAFEQITAVRDRNLHYDHPVVALYGARKRGKIGVNAVTQDESWRSKRSPTDQSGHTDDEEEADSSSDIDMTEDEAED